MLLKLLATLTIAFADDSLTVINLQHRNAESLIPILRNIYGREATISGMNMKLFIKATPTTVAEIRQLTNDLDGKPRMLRVAIRDNSQGTAKTSQLGVSGRAGAGPARFGVRSPGATNGVGGAVVGVGSGPNSARLIANETSIQQNTSGERFIMVEEGVPASLGDGNGTQVVARVTGDQVSVQIVPAQPGTSGAPVTDGASLNTTASAPVGQWVPLGGTQSSAQASKSGILNGANEASQSSSQLMLKVDPQ